MSFKDFHKINQSQLFLKVLDGYFVLKHTLKMWVIRVLFSLSNSYLSHEYEEFTWNFNENFWKLHSWVKIVKYFLGILQGFWSLYFWCPRLLLPHKFLWYTHLISGQTLSWILSHLAGNELCIMSQRQENLAKFQKLQVEEKVSQLLKIKIKET